MKLKLHGGLRFMRRLVLGPKAKLKTNEKNFSVLSILNGLIYTQRIGFGFLETFLKKCLSSPESSSIQSIVFVLIEYLFLL